MQTQELNFRLRLPISQKNLVNAERLTRYELISDVIKSSQDNARLTHYLSSKLSEEWTLSYQLNAFLQKPIQDLTNCSQTQLSLFEKVYLDDSSMIGSYHSITFPTICVFMKRVVSNNQSMCEKEIDVINESLPIFDPLIDKINKRLCKVLGVTNLQNWQKSYTKETTVLDFSYIINAGYEQANFYVFQAIQYSIISHLIYFYKSMVLFASKMDDESDPQSVIDSLHVMSSTREKSLKHKSNADTFSLIPITDFSLLKSHTNFQSGISSLQEAYKNPVSIFSSSIKIVKESKLLKRGEGPFDFNWNERYCVLDQSHLTYYKSVEKSEPRGRFQVGKAVVGNICDYDGREFALKLEWLKEGRTIWLSADSPNILKEWKLELLKLSLRVFDSKDLEYFVSKNENNGGIEAQLDEDLNPQGTSLHKIKKLDSFVESGVEFLHKEQIEQTIFGDLKKSNAEWEFYKVKNRVKLYTLKSQFVLHNPKLRIIQKLKTIFPLILFLIISFVLRFLSVNWVYSFPLILLAFGLYTLNKIRTTKTGIPDEYIYLKGQFLFKRPLNTVINYAVNLKNLLKWNQAFYSVSIRSANKFEAVLNKYKNILGPMLGDLKSSDNAFLLSIQNMSHTYQVQEFYSFEEIPGLPDSCILNCTVKVTYQEKKLKPKQIIKDFENHFYSLIKLNEMISNNVLPVRVFRISENIHPDEHATFFTRGKPFLQTKPENFSPTIDLIKEMIMKTGNEENGCTDFKGILVGHEQRGNQSAGNHPELRKTLFMNFFDYFAWQKTDNLRKMVFPAAFTDRKCLFARIAEAWGFLPVYLVLANDSTENTERLKFVICFVLAGLGNIKLNGKIPCMPYAGETYQAFFTDGSTIDFEQIDENKTCFFLEDVKGRFCLHGKLSFRLNLIANLVLVEFNGDIFIEFGKSKPSCKVERKPSTKKSPLTSDINTSKTWIDGSELNETQNEIFVIKYPRFMVSGLVSDKQNCALDSTLLVEYKQRNLSAIVEFAKPDDCAMQNRQTITGQIKSTNEQKTHSMITGIWPISVFFDDICFWKRELVTIAKVVSDNRLLPSDSSLREDLYNLNKDKINTSRFMRIQVALRDQIIKQVKKMSQNQ